MIMKENPRMVVKKFLNRKGKGYLNLCIFPSQNIEFHVNAKSSKTPLQTIKLKRKEGGKSNSGIHCANTHPLCC